MNQHQAAFTSNPVEQLHPQYRPDIDGLRALAVLSVLFYHAFPRAVTGGFVGVDVFFVISGFLISTILLKSLERVSSVNILNFYGRRIRRIFPALFLVLLACLAFGLYFLLSGELEQLGKHIAGGAAFVSNLVLWNESGYFDAAAETKPLLHLWSLGVEEQFYIVWPLLLWLAWKWRLNLLTVCCSYVVISFAVNIYMLKVNPVGDFYSPQSRFWQMSVGSVWAVAMLRYPTMRTKVASKLNGYLSSFLFDQTRTKNAYVLRDVASAGGIVLILIGVFGFNTLTKFPGWMALMPTLGAVLYIAAGPHGILNRTVFSTKLAVWIGLISFPLYLWHWPLLVFSRIVSGGELSAGGRWVAIAASVVLAWLTYALVEKRVRHTQNVRAVTLLLAAGVALIGIAGYVIFALQGLPNRPWANDAESRALQMVAKINSYANQYGSKPCFQLPNNTRTAWFEENGCLTANFPDRPTVFLLGDSHSAALSIGLRELAAAYHFNLMQMSSGWCAPFGNNESDPACVETNRFADEQIRRVKPDVLILDAYWLHEGDAVFYKGPDFIAHLENRFAQLKNLGARRMIIVGQIPTWTGPLPDILTRRYAKLGLPVPDKTKVDLDPLAIQFDAKMRRMHLPEHTQLVPLVDQMCSEAGCMTKVGSDLANDLIVWDYGHLTINGSRWVNQHFLLAPLTAALGLK